MAVYNAATLYQGTKVNTASPAELTLMLYDEQLNFAILVFWDLKQMILRR